MVGLVSGCWNHCELRSFGCCQFWSLICVALLLLLLLVLVIALCSYTLCSVQAVEQGGRGCTHTIYIVDFWVDYGPVVFPSHIEEIFHVKIVCLIYVFLHITFRHRQSIFFTGSHKVMETRPLVFPLRRVTFPSTQKLDDRLRQTNM